MKYSLLIIVAIFTSILASCKSLEEREEAAVYGSFIDNFYINQQFSDDRFENKSFKTIVIEDQTSGFIIPFSYQEKIAQLPIKPDEETVKNFLTRNDGYYPKSKLTDKTLEFVGRYPLNRSIKFRLPHTLISDSKIDKIFNGNGEWDEFYKQYPTSRGIVSLSRVGFNKNKTESLLYFAQQYDDSAGEGFLILFTKTHGEWKEIARVVVWIS
jgi:hypothetical protein